MKKLLKPGYVVLFVVMVVAVVGSLTLLGSPVSEVFSNIDSGLSVGPGTGGMTEEVSVQDMAARAPMEEPVEEPGADDPSQAVQRMIIKNASLSLEVSDIDEVGDRVRTLAEESGGYVVETSQSGSGENMSLYVSFRVPAERFDQVLAEVQGLADEVLQQRISGQDVTAEFVDLESQERNLEATRDRLLKLMEQADEVEDALAVSTALSDIQGQLEVIQGRMKYLRQNVAMSTIDVSLSTPYVAPPGEGWKPLGVAGGAFQAMMGLVQFLINVVIVAAVWVPVWGLLLVAGWWVRRRFFNKPKPD